MKAYISIATTRGEFQHSNGRDDSVGPAPRTRSTSGSAEDEIWKVWKFDEIFVCFFFNIDFHDVF